MNSLKKILIPCLALSLVTLASLPASAANIRKDSESNLLAVATQIVKTAQEILASRTNGSAFADDLREASQNTVLPLSAKGEFKVNSYTITSTDLPGESITIKADANTERIFILSAKNFSIKVDASTKISHTIPAKANPATASPVANPNSTKSSSNSKNDILTFANAIVTLDNKVINLSREYQKTNPTLSLLASAKAVINANHPIEGVTLTFNSNGYAITVKDQPKLKLTTIISGNTVTRKAIGFDLKTTKPMDENTVNQLASEKVLYSFAKTMIRDASANAAIFSGGPIQAGDIKWAVNDSSLPSNIILSSTPNSFTLSTTQLPSESLTVTLNPKDPTGVTITLKGFRLTLKDLTK